MSGNPGDELRALIRQIAQQEAKAIVRALVRNRRPGGFSAGHWTVGASGVSLTADPTASLIQGFIPFPCDLAAVELRSDPACLATIHLKAARPGQTLATAESLFGLAGNDAVLDDGFGGPADTKTVLPFADWTTHLEAGTTVYVYVLAATGAEVVTVNLVAHNTESVD